VLGRGGVDVDGEPVESSRGFDNGFSKKASISSSDTVGSGGRGGGALGSGDAELSAASLLRVVWSSIHLIICCSRPVDNEGSPASVRRNAPKSQGFLRVQP